MDPRLSVHAGAPARRQEVRTIAAVLIAALASSTASAAPRTAPAKAAFERGVVAYQRGDFAAAAEALGTSFKLEPDVETLFAWAQAERQQDNCTRAIELFDRLLTFELPPENKKVVRSKIEECRQILAAKQPPPEPVVEPAPPPAPPPRPVPIRRDPPPPKPSAGTPWWQDPLGDTLAGAGLIGLGVGGYYLLSAREAARDADETTDYNQFGPLDDRAKSHGRIGVIVSIAGGALLVGGIIRYATRDSGATPEQKVLTGWLVPGGGGLAAAGRF